MVLLVAVLQSWHPRVRSSSKKRPRSPILIPRPTLFGRQVATNGEYALVLGSRDDLPAPGSEDELRHRHALLYRRVAGQWQFQQVLRSHVRAWDSYNYPDLSRDERQSRGCSSSTATSRPIGSAPPAGSPPGKSALQPKTSKSTASASCSPLATAAGPPVPWNRMGQAAGSAPACRDSRAAATTKTGAGPADIAGDRVIIGTPDAADLEIQEVPI